jgi:Ribbon-helix-helix domain
MHRNQPFLQSVNSLGGNLTELTFHDMSCHNLIMPPQPARRFRMQTIYLEPEKADALDALSTSTRIPKAALLREAVDDLLGKHRGKRPKRKA